MSIYTTYNYFETKKRLINEINQDVDSLSLQLKNILPYFINSYAINEYEKLIENQLRNKNILAIKIKDYNYGKIFSKDFVENGKIKIDEKIVNFEANNLTQKEILSNSFSFKNHTLKNDSDMKIAEIEVYSTDKYLKNELNVIIKKSLYEILISSLIIVTLLFFIIKTFVLKPIHNIIKVIQDDCEEGLPKNIIPSNNTKELNELASKMNEMIATIKTSRLKIKEINNRLELILNSMNDGIWDWNLKTNEVYFSPQWKKMLGFNDDEIISSLEEWINRVNPKHLELVYEDINNYFQGKTEIYKNEHQVLCKDGTYKWILDRGIIVERDGENNPLRMIGTHTDITFIKELEKQIIKDRDFISTIIDNSNAIIAVINSDGVMFKVNKYAQEFLGYTQEEIASVPYFWSRFLNENIKDKVVDIINEAKKGNIVKNFKNSWISKNDEERVFEWSNMLVQKEDGSMDYLATIGINISEKEFNQKQILEQKQEFELIFNYSKDGIAILDFDTRFIKFNNSLVEMTGLSKEILSEKKLLDFSTSQDMEKNRKIFKKVIQEGYINNYEDVFIFANKRVYVNLSLSLLPDKKRVLMLIKDVSSLKIIQEQAKLASLGEMIGNIAHQWRQPLSFISTSASALKVKSEFNMLNKEDIEESSNAIVKQTEYLSNTIDNFRDFIKEDKSYKEISIKEILENTLNLTHASLHNNFIKLVLDIEADLKIYGNKNELTEAFLNIISNSKDVLKDKNEEDRLIFIKTKKLDKNRLEISFLDSGGGIDESIISKVLEPYFTTKHKSQGTGLGLTIVDKIVRERHKGIIEIYNEAFTYNQKQYIGTCFSIIFDDKF
ncbi:MAG: PAS domain S-box protein [Arcobacter sp.]|uniref:PAS domain S-box protein n=1 Tax=Arcobacter sp. TaxID=1872629 RepID=UPI003CFF451F